MRRSGCQNAVKEASKVLRKEIRAIAKARKSARICKVLEEFKDLQRIAGIRGCGKQMFMTSVLDIDGTEKTEAGDIAEVFAAFFESLYQGDGAAFHSNEPFDRIDRVTTEEIRQQLKKMRLGKSPDDNGIVAELMRNGGDLLLQTIADISTAVLDPLTAVPDYWKASSIRVLFKQGDDRLPGNYRPFV